MDKFFDPGHMAFVEDARFRLHVGNVKYKTGRRLLVISLHGLDEPARQALRHRYLSSFERGFVSFPLKYRGKHLMTRIDRRIFNFGRAFVNWIPQFRTKAYKIPGSSTLEVFVRLTAAEETNLQTYLGNIKQNRAGTIGRFTMEGHQYSRGRLNDNATLKGGHNCSSWIAFAPIGIENLSLLETLGGSRELEVATNPGWLTNWLAAAAPAERIPFVLHWTPLPLSEALLNINPAQNFAWDFNRH
ncbi:MAG: hypothetical protein EOP11_05760 [Proteobacteria bacterium]|nr:MAG: hypothetical protein EOP11_05760 [Pseudomonadota bacterium]